MDLKREHIGNMLLLMMWFIDTTTSSDRVVVKSRRVCTTPLTERWRCTS